MLPYLGALSHRDGPRTPTTLQEACELIHGHGPVVIDGLDEASAERIMRAEMGLGDAGTSSQHSVFPTWLSLLQAACKELRHYQSIKQSWWGASVMSESFIWRCRTIVLELVRIHGMDLESVSGRLQGDRAVVLTAVRQNGRALQYASEWLQDDAEVVLAAVSQDGRALQYASEYLQDNREVVLTAVREDGRALQYASEYLKHDREVAALVQ